jgi:CheY-like chemotaxis protein
MSNGVMVVGEKETFIIRVLVKKIKDAGYDAYFVPWDINDINSSWEKSGLITMFIDENCNLPENVLHFLNDKMSEDGKKLILAGDKLDVQDALENVSGDIVYRTFFRPVDNEAFVGAITELFKKIESGDFKKSILVVDDDPGYLTLVREWLKDTYKVAMVNSGLQALKWLGKNKADLILLDHEMPVTTGPQVLEMLRSDEDTKNIPVIFLTGKGDKESVMAVVALRPEGYFLKTIEKEELLEKLREFFILH